MTFAAMSLTAMFDSSLTGRATHDALEVAGADGEIACYTFGDLGARSAAMAATLSARGLRQGDRCLVRLPNGAEFIDMFLACVRLGVIFVPVNVMYRDRELSHIVDDCDPGLIVTGDGDRAVFGSDARVRSIEDLEREAGFGAATSATAVAPSRVDADAPAMIIYTSGTTGRAKGAVLSRRNLAANVTHLAEAWRITADDRYLAALPLFHVHGLGNGVCAWLATGCLMRLAGRFDAAQAQTWFEDFRPTLFFGVPTMYVRMLEWNADDARRIGARVRLFVSGSAPLPAHVHAAFEGRFGHRILERYGMSETLMNLGNPYDGDRRAGSVGMPFAGVRARVADAGGAEVPDGTVGELDVRGPNVFAGYWRNPEATAAAFRDGWFRTGDMAVRAPDGYYTLRGRAGDLIITGGFNMYPREVEEVLLDVPGVREAAVVGVPDERRGEIPVAYVVVDANVTDETLRAACSADIASFKVPRTFVRVSALPRTALGKVQKHLLPRPGSP